MQPLIDRAAALVHRIGRSAVPAQELVRMLREGGASVSEPVLLRALAAEPERFRLVEPAGALRALGGDLFAASTWVVAAAPDAPGELPEAQRPALRRLAASVGRLGWCLDTTSPSDVARWFGMLMEEERFRTDLASGRGEGGAALSDGEAEPIATRRPRRSPPRGDRAPRTRRGARPARA